MLPRFLENICTRALHTSKTWATPMFIQILCHAWNANNGIPCFLNRFIKILCYLARKTHIHLHIHFLRRVYKITALNATILLFTYTCYARSQTREKFLLPS